MRPADDSNVHLLHVHASNIESIYDKLQEAVPRAVKILKSGGKLTPEQVAKWIPVHRAIAMANESVRDLEHIRPNENDRKAARLIEASAVIEDAQFVIRNEG